MASWFPVIAIVVIATTATMHRINANSTIDWPFRRLCCRDDFIMSMRSCPHTTYRLNPLQPALRTCRPSSVLLRTYPTCYGAHVANGLTVADRPQRLRGGGQRPVVNLGHRRLVGNPCEGRPDDDRRRARHGHDDPGQQ